jgi:hypothetical protein
MVALLLRNLVAAAAPAHRLFSMVQSRLRGDPRLFQSKARFRPSWQSFVFVGARRSATESRESQKRSFSTSTRREAGKIVSLTDINDRLTYH